ncbi:MAG: AsmA-like C-terminal region-containing protein, partial [Candidatus Rokubacteria bacterium]|nr:AsmA-like C-terminal region-containing protein [Candidatus Rokubacteria bacterium]
ARGELEIAGTLAAPSARGELRLERLVVSEERPACAPRARRELELRAVRLPFTVTAAELTLRPLEARVADGTVSMRVGRALSPGGPLRLSDVQVKGLSLAPVLVGYLCQGYAVSGPLTLAGEARLDPADPWRTLGGSGTLAIGKGKVMGSALSALLHDVTGIAGLARLVPEARPGQAVASPLEFDAITASYTITGGIARTEDFLYRGPGATVAAVGTYGLADHRVDLQVTLSQDRNQVKAAVTGTAPGRLRIVPTEVRRPDPESLRRFLDRLFR